MHYPKISIVTPSFNQDHFIEETITSVLDQNYPNLEYIIVDGGSSDKSVEIIKKYQKHLSFWVSELDNGQSAAINKGFAKTTGDIFNWLNSDDYLEKGSLKRIAEVFQDPKILLFAGQCRKFGYGCIETIIPEQHAPVPLLEKLFNINYLQPSVFISKKALDKIGGVSEHLHLCMDYELYFKFFLYFNLESVFEENSVLAHARLHPESKTAKQFVHFTRELNSVWYHFIKHLDKQFDTLNKIEKLGVLKNYTPNWNINVSINKEIVNELILSKIKPMLDDPSYIYRTAAGYYTFLGDKKNAYKNSLFALQKSPDVFLNYKYLAISLINFFK